MAPRQDLNPQSEKGLRVTYEQMITAGRRAFCHLDHGALLRYDPECGAVQVLAYPAAPSDLRVGTGSIHEPLAIGFAVRVPRQLGERPLGKSSDLSGRVWGGLPPALLRLLRPGSARCVL